MLHHIKVDHQPSTDTSYHTSTAMNYTDAMTEFQRLTEIWPHRFITVVAYSSKGPIFITSNDDELNAKFVQKRLKGNEARVDTPAHQAITDELIGVWQVAA